jgi:imidazole glycerol-phosphate synthase subunit HisH
MITVVDYGCGNLGSIVNMLRKIGAPAALTSSPRDVEQATKLILPGVGAFDAGMSRLAQSGLLPVLNRKVLEEKVPVLGICLGMQLMTRGSEEGSHKGLAWIDADTLHFAGVLGPDAKVPHMGWNKVAPAKASGLLAELPEQPRFYFVHSYFVRCARREDVLLKTTYASRQFDAAFEHANVAGVQFHPEKSHRFGMRLLRNFVERS